MTQGQLGDATDISSVSIGYYERGMNYPPRAKLVRLAQALEIRVADLTDAAVEQGRTLGFEEKFQAPYIAGDSSWRLRAAEAFRKLRSELDRTESAVLSDAP